MRPIFLVSSMEQTPTTREENTKGTISILIRLMKTVPIGLIVFRARPPDGTDHQAEQSRQ